MGMQMLSSRNLNFLIHFDTDFASQIIVWSWEILVCDWANQRLRSNRPSCCSNAWDGLATPFPSPGGPKREVPKSIKSSVFGGDKSNRV